MFEDKEHTSNSKNTISLASQQLLKKQSSLLSDILVSAASLIKGSILTPDSEYLSKKNLGKEESSMSHSTDFDSTKYNLSSISKWSHDKRKRERDLGDDQKLMTYADHQSSLYKDDATPYLLRKQNTQSSCSLQGHCLKSVHQQESCDGEEVVALLSDKFVPTSSYEDTFCSTEAQIPSALSSTALWPVSDESSSPGLFKLIPEIEDSMWYYRQWEGVQTHYTDIVWGDISFVDLMSHANIKHSEIEKASALALQRLKIISAHLPGSSTVLNC